MTLSAEDAAARILPQLVGLGLVTVFTSPWARTEPVARSVAARLGVPVVVDARLSELAMGTFEGRPFDRLEVEEREAFFAWMNDWKRTAPPAGENLPTFVARVGAWFAERHAANVLGPVLAVTHAGVIRALRAASRGVDYDALVGEEVLHLAVERIDVRAS